ncbi:MAG: cytochrome bc complex cytochrome b subunit [Candidatus Glassbacteria bacterium RIFCSPLOWO2_12_FULL_58_11]|uniref:Cytochrome bc complex cytochrome b subunit n=1 Tax=Candidatus Glassbacteria bacterium RIFCSPLOWO2_12_FULL_58_11 TaxID=1817867 RepID=A0A1F5YWS1_9BACT|nr:MAG: cytochrome bc complex cytochrome b subunit [Candidatus Glassbacteria bacterium RIFCSPLOWO2_12_FULL_58_11]
MPLKKYYDQAYGWVNERIDVDGIIGFMRHKEVPISTHSIWYYFGGISLFLFLVQVTSGILLLMYYRPGPESSYESLQFLVSKVHFGWLVRDLHSWSANLMVLCVFIHMFSVFFMKSYRKPREMTWMSGMVLLGLCLGFGFSGYLLPWNELSFFATKVGTDMAGSLPAVGDFIVRVIRGGPDVTGATLSRFFGIHVAVLPGIFTLVLAFHLFLLQRQGMSQPLSWDKLPAGEKKTMPFFPNFVLRELMFWMFALAVINALAVFFPWELGVKADPFASAPAGIKPEWYFMFMFQTLKFLPPTIGSIEGELVGLAVFSLGGLLWLTLPLWDRWTGTDAAKARYISWIGVAIVGFIIVMTMIGYALS